MVGKNIFVVVIPRPIRILGCNGDVVAGERPVLGERDQGRESLGCSKSRLWRSIVGTCLRKVRGYMM